MEQVYKIKTTTSQDESAKITEFSSAEMDLSYEAPGFLFSVHGKEDLQDLSNLIQENIPYLLGVHVPYHHIEDFGEDIMEELVDGKQFLLTNGGLEAIYYSGIEESKQEMVQNLPFNENERNKIKSIQNSQSSVEKSKMHAELWDLVIENPQRALNFVYKYTLPMRQLDLHTVNAPAPFIRSTSELDAAEYLYEITKAYFGSSEGPSAVHVAMELNLSKQFLKKESNLTQLYKTLERIEPESLILRIPDVKDIRDSGTDAEKGWKEVVKELGAYSEENHVPLNYIAFSTEGPLTIAHGADLFATRPTKSGNLLEKEFKLPKEDMRKLWKENPFLTSGKIRQYEGERKLWTRGELIEVIEEKNEFPYPFDINDYKPAEVENMTDRNYREFAKIISSKVYSQEIDEIRQAIEGDEVKGLKSKYKDWMTDTQLLP